MAAFQKHAPAGLREDLSVSLSATSTLVASPLRTKSVVPATKFAFGRHMETDKVTFIHVTQGFVGHYTSPTSVPSLLNRWMRNLRGRRPCWRTA